MKRGGESCVAKDHHCCIPPVEAAHEPGSEFDTCYVKQTDRFVIVRMCVLSHCGLVLKKSETGQVPEKNRLDTLQSLDRHTVLGLN